MHRQQCFHTSVKLCAIDVVKVVTVYRTNNMIRFSQMVTTHVSAFLHDDGNEVGLFILLFHLRILGDDVIFIPFPSPPSPSLVGGLSTPPLVRPSLPSTTTTSPTS